MEIRKIVKITTNSYHTVNLVYTNDLANTQIKYVVRKYNGINLLKFLCGICSTECKKCNNFKIWSDDKLREVYATNNSSMSTQDNNGRLIFTWNSVRELALRLTSNILQITITVFTHIGLDRPILTFSARSMVRKQNFSIYFYIHVTK